MLHHCIDNREEFAHAGGDSDFLEFAGGKETLVESLDHRIESSGDDRWHVETGPDMSSASPAGSLPPHLAAIPIERGYTHESSDLSAVEFTELRKARYESRRPHEANPRNTLKKIVFFAPERALFDETSHLGLHFLKRPCKPRKMSHYVLANSPLAW